MKFGFGVQKSFASLAPHKSSQDAEVNRATADAAVPRLKRRVRSRTSWGHVEAHASCVGEALAALQLQRLELHIRLPTLQASCFVGMH